MVLLLLISYFVHWMHYPNTATNCAFDMHRQEGGREGGRQAERKRERDLEREDLFSCQGLFQPAHATMQKALQNQVSVLASSVPGILTSSNQISVSSISRIKLYCPVYRKDPIV